MLCYIEQDPKVALLDHIRSGSMFPWNFVPKWPISRRERVDELEVLSEHYNNTPQRANVAAAIDWHKKIPAWRTSSR